jgi:hypothetical protein
MKKLLEQQNATNLAISVLCDLSKTHCSMCEWEQECSDNPLLFNPIFAKQYIKERQSWLINKQPMCEKCKLQIEKHYSQNVSTLFKEQKINVDSKTEMPANKAAPNSIHQQCHDFSNSDKIPIARSDANVFTDNFPFQELNSQELIKTQNELRAKQKLINSQETSVFNQNDEINSDGEIFLINETLREPLMHIANKLLGRQRLSFEQLTPPEQQLWSLFEKSDIFEFLTGQTDTVPQFENYFTFGATPKVNINIQRIAQNLHPIPHTNNQGPIQRALSDPTQVAHFLRERKAKIDYKALHLGHQIQQAAKDVKQKCKQMKKSVRKSAKATVTKLAPGAFSPKQQVPASAPASPRPSSSSSWTFWPSK